MTAILFIIPCLSKHSKLTFLEPREGFPRCPTLEKTLECKKLIMYRCEKPNVFTSGMTFQHILTLVEYGSLVSGLKTSNCGALASVSFAHEGLRDQASSNTYATTGET